MQRIVSKSVNLDLVGLDGNAFALIGSFSRAAKRDGWTPDELKSVMDEATSSDYDHLLATLVAHCDHVGDNDEQS